MNKIIDILQSYQVDTQRGFLPKQDPPSQLPVAYKSWDDLANNLSAYINAGIIREKIEALELIEHPQFKLDGEWERALLLLTAFAHAYVHYPPDTRKHLPAAVAVPLIKVARHLKREPVLSHSSVVLNNWRRLDKSKPIQLDNLATIIHFHGGLDESWFYLVTVEIEQVGAAAIPLVLEAMDLATNGHFEQTTIILEQVNTILGNLLLSLQKMYDHCDPYVFFLRVRPFLGSFVNIDFLETGLPLQNLHGASAAQSSLLQFFDAAFGIDYDNEHTKNYLLLMRQHMPEKHAKFLRFIEKTTTLRTDALKDYALHDSYKKCIQRLIEFRNEHLKIVALYIMKQAKKMNASSKGTGGTSPMVFLKSVRNRNEEMKDF